MDLTLPEKSRAKVQLGLEGGVPSNRQGDGVGGTCPGHRQGSKLSVQFPHMLS